MHVVYAHKADYARKMKAFEKLGEVFVREVPSPVFEHQQKPSTKSLKEYFDNMFDSHRRIVKANYGSSGIREVV